MVAVALKRVAFYRNNNLQMSLVRTHFIHLVINVLSVASSLLPSLHSFTIPLPLVFCHPPAIRPCHTNVGSFKNISFSSMFWPWLCTKLALYNSDLIQGPNTGAQELQFALVSR